MQSVSRQRGRGLPKSAFRIIGVYQRHRLRPRCGDIHHLLIDKIGRATVGVNHNPLKAEVRNARSYEVEDVVRFSRDVVGMELWVLGATGDVQEGRDRQFAGHFTRRDAIGANTRRGQKALDRPSAVFTAAA